MPIAVDRNLVAGRPISAASAGCRVNLLADEKKVARRRTAPVPGERPAYRPERPVVERDRDAFRAR